MFKAIDISAPIPDSGARQSVITACELNSISSLSDLLDLVDSKLAE